MAAPTGVLAEAGEEEFSTPGLANLRLQVGNFSKWNSEPFGCHLILMGNQKETKHVRASLVGKKKPAGVMSKREGFKYEHVIAVAKEVKRLCVDRIEYEPEISCGCIFVRLGTKKSVQLLMLKMNARMRSSFVLGRFGRQPVWGCFC